jgi:hypothetical protein
LIKRGGTAAGLRLQFLISIATSPPGNRRALLCRRLLAVPSLPPRRFPSPAQVGRRKLFGNRLPTLRGAVHALFTVPGCGGGGIARAGAEQAAQGGGGDHDR